MTGDGQARFRTTGAVVRREPAAARREAPRQRRRGAPTGLVALDRPRDIPSAPRIAAHRRRANLGQALTTISLLLLLSAALVGGGFALQSNTFRLRHLTLTGASPEVLAQVEDSLAPGCQRQTPTGTTEQFTCSGELLGPNLLTLDARQVEHQLQSIPAVQSSVARPILPNGLSVRIIPRQAVAAWVVGSDVYRVAGDGVVIGPGTPQGLKVVIGQVGGNPIHPGDKVDAQVLKGAEQLNAKLPSLFGITPTRIQYSPDSGLAVIGPRGLIAMFGPPSDLSLKMAELQRITQLAQNQKHPLTFVDLRYKTPYYRTS